MTANSFKFEIYHQYNDSEQS